MSYGIGIPCTSKINAKIKYIYSKNKEQGLECDIMTLGQWEEGEKIEQGAGGGSLVIDPSVRVNLTQLESLGYPPRVGFPETPTCTGFFLISPTHFCRLPHPALELDCACFQCVLPHFVHLQGRIRSRSTDAWDTDGANVWLDTRQTDEQKDEQEITWSLPFTIYFIWSGGRRWLPLEGSTFFFGRGLGHLSCVLGFPILSFCLCLPVL